MQGARFFPLLLLAALLLLPSLARADEGSTANIDIYNNEICVDTYGIDNSAPENLIFRMDVVRKGKEAPSRSVTVSLPPLQSSRCMNILGVKGAGGVGPGFWRACLYRVPGTAALRCVDRERLFQTKPRILRHKIVGGNFVFSVRVPQAFIGQRFKMLQGQCRKQYLRPEGAPPEIKIAVCPWTKVKRFSKVFNRRVMTFKQPLLSSSTHVQLDIRSKKGVVNLNGNKAPFSLRLIRKFQGV